MAKKWAEVTATPQFQALAPDAQEQARQQYFSDVITPHVPADQVEKVRAHFDADTAPKAPAPVAAAPPAPAVPPAQPSEPSLAMAPVGGAEMLLKAGTGALASIPAGVAYGGAAIGKALGADVSPSEVQGKVQRALTYAPVSDSAKAGEQALSNIVRPVVEPIAHGADVTATAVGKVSPTAETMLREAPAAATAALGVLPAAGLVKPALQVAADAGVLSPSGLGRETLAAAGVKPVRPPEGIANVRGGSAIARGRAMGYKFRPSDVRATDPSAKVPGLRREGLTQPNDLRRDVTLENQAVTTREAATEIGAKNKTGITPEEFDRLRVEPMKKYDATGKAVGTFRTTPEFSTSLDAVGARTGLEPSTRRKIKAQADQYRVDSMSGPDTVKTVSALRRRATAQMRSQDVLTQDMGHANRAIADAMESELGRQLEARGETALHGEFQTARTSLAKLHDVQSVTRAGHVDAAGLAKLATRGVPLTGRLKTIAEVADAAPNVMRHSTRATGVGNSVKAETLTGMAKDVTKGVARKLIPGLNVTSERFQAKHFGRQATTTEQSYAGEAGKRQVLSPPRPQKPPQLGTGDVEFQQQGGVMPSRAQTLAGDLGLASEPVQGAQQFPPAPDKLTADVVPPTASGGLPFTSSEPLLARLADSLGLAQEAPRGGLNYTPPTLADTLAGDLSLAPAGFEQPGHAALDLQGLAEQLGLKVNTPQEPPRFLPMNRPPGRVGRPKGARRGKD